MTWGTYGVRAGVWRLLKILDENKVPPTFAANARSLELAPAAAKQIITSGHEICAHSYLQDSILAYLSPEEERAADPQEKDLITAVSGETPKGWISPVLASTAHTETFVAEEGFLWYGDYNHIDLPFCVQGRLAHHRRPAAFGFRRPSGAARQSRDWYDVYKDTFDYLYHQRADVLSEHHSALPFRRPAADRRTDRSAFSNTFGVPRVWMVRHDELAQWIRDHGIRSGRTQSASIRRPHCSIVGTNRLEDSANVRSRSIHRRLSRCACG